MKTKVWTGIKRFLWIIAGCVIFALGFDVFLLPHQFGAGGVSGLAVIINAFLPFLSVGMISLIVNIPLFIAGYRSIGRRFFWGSLAGMLLSSILIDAFSFLPKLQTEPLLGAIFGGLLVGGGCGIVFMQGASTGGVDIAARLMKRRLQELPIGKVILMVDMCIAVFTGIAFRDLSKILYCIVALFVCSEATDAIVYRLDYSYSALIITDFDEAVRDGIDEKLERGCTILKGEGSYTHQEKNVIFCAVKRQQIAELKELVIGIDPNAFLVVQEAHQVLGEGFERYSRNRL